MSPGLLSFLSDVPLMCGQINVREQVESTLEVRASDLDLSLLMSTVTNLTDFIEDEILPGPLPMEVSRVGTASGRRYCVGVAKWRLVRVGE